MMSSVEERPLITFALIAYNQERFIREAVEGALNQTYTPLEVILSDDCSTDRTLEIMQQSAAGYKGPHTVRLARTPHNLGLSGHINYVMDLAQGQLIVIAAGDDVSLPERVETINAAYEASGGTAISLYSNAIIIDKYGNPERLFMSPPSPDELSLSVMSKRLGGVLGCTHAWDRRAFDVFGPLNEQIVREDAVIPFRSALLGQVKFIPEPLVLYRKHTSNINFIDPEELMSPQALYADALKHSQGHIAVFENRLQDLDTISRLSPTREGELLDIRLETQRVLQDVTDEAYLLANTNFLKRIRVMGRALWRGTPPKRVAKWFLMFFFPRLYVVLQVCLRARTHAEVRKRSVPGQNSASVR
jgi:glycosyltransferase involved in cell wall biosynthesis